MKNKIQLLLLLLFFLFSIQLNSFELSDNEIKDAVTLTQSMIDRALNDGSQKPLFIMVGRGPAPIDTLLEYAGFDIQHIPLSIKSELQRRRMGSKEISIKEDIQGILTKLFPPQK